MGKGRSDGYNHASSVSLQAGTRFGPYEIHSPLGVGGMGEVYRARDPRVHRDVAIKVLPALLARDHERLQRFQREAQALASLNHPNIALLYGVEDVDGVRGLVMELVDGPTLADLIARAAAAGGPRRGSSVLPMADVLSIARQIADALEAAHEHDLVHRDLKPGNVKVTPAGMTKLLDFGLAKALGDDPASGNLVNSPTITSIGTRAGVILGTAAYMSPEQARGRPVDKRTDIWAFGCVVYEMLTGRPAFGGEDVTDVLVGIIEREPDLTALPGETPPALARLLRRCLVKDRRYRLADIADARLDIDEALAPAGSPSGAGSGLRSRRRLDWRVPLLIGLAAGAAGAASMMWAATRTAPPRPIRVVIAPPPSDPLYSEAIGGQIALSPDGTRVVYVGAREGPQLYARRLDELDASPIPGTLGARQPFFSPDGATIGFWAAGESEIRTVPFGRGAVVTICKAPTDNFRGAVWAPDGSIIFGSGGLYRVPASGGTPQPVTSPAGEQNEIEHRWPDMLPGGQAVVYTVWAGSNDRSRIAVRRLQGGESKTLLEGATSARYSPTGHLLYSQSGIVVSTSFDPETFTVGEDRVAVQENVKTTVSGASDFAISRDGTFIFIPGSATDRRLVWVDRQGRTEPLHPQPDDYWSPRFSPDGTRLAVGIGPDIHVLELKRPTRTRVTFGTTGALFPFTWSADGSSILFSRVDDRKEGLDIVSVPADGSTPPKLLAAGEQRQWATSVAMSGTVALYEQQAGTLRDIWMLATDGKRSVFLATPFQERVPRFSPDGRWVAYVSNDSGRDEVYVRPAAGTGGKVTVSSDGGTEPAWASNGRELFYRRGDRVLAAAVATGPTFTASPPRVLFEGLYERDRGSGGAYPNYDVAPDGQRFAMIQAPTASSNIVVVLNWFEDLKARLGGGRR